MNPFVARLRKLHEKAKKGTLGPDEKKEYTEARIELGRLLLVAQSLGNQGQTLRASLRVSQILKVTVDYGPGTSEKTATLDISATGFAVLLANALNVGQTVAFTLDVPPVVGQARVVKGFAAVATTRPRGSVHRVAFVFRDLAPADLEHIEMVIVEAVLARFDARNAAT